MNHRLGALRKLLASKKLDGYIAAKDKNMEYFTGFSGSSMLLVPQEGESIFFVYGINFEIAKEKVQGARIELIKTGKDIAKRVANEIDDLKLCHIGYDSLEASNYLRMNEILEEAKLEDAGDIVWSLRKVKDEYELRLVTRAAEITSRGMKVAFEIITAGLSEREIAAEMEYAMRKSGSDGLAFETIVSSGPNSAFPHGGCGDREIRKGDFIVIDIGAKYQGYCADITRTFIVGKPSPRQRKTYETTKKAQSLALSQVQAGIEAKVVDKITREYITKRGYGEYFVHNLGHGIGLDVHEPPALGPVSKDILTAGNTVTIEPGIYIPKFGGVRIEDTVLVLKDQIKMLTKAPVAFSP